MHRRFHRLSMLWALLVALSLAAGCGSSPGSSGSAEPPETAPGPATIQITDAAGRDVALPALPQRIVVAGRGPYMTLHLLYMFPEARARLVGMEKKGQTASDFLPLVDPGSEDKPTLAGSAGPEQIAALEPDLVLMKSVTVEQMSKSLEPLGIALAYLGLETPDQFFQDVANLGPLLGNESPTSTGFGLSSPPAVPSSGSRLFSSSNLTLCSAGIVICFAAIGDANQRTREDNHASPLKRSPSSKRWLWRTGSGAQSASVVNC